MIDAATLKRFETISLDEMAGVRLMNRTDTKFITTIDKIQKLLILASADYRIQEINNETNLPYYTLYYDTPDGDMFYQHQRGKKNRQKIRVRKYEGSETPPFIEIKNKNNKGRTSKKRVSMEDEASIEPFFDFISANSAYDPASLVASIENHFFRITLVNRELTERVTIDSNIEFHNIVTGNRVHLPNLVVIEWKRDGRNRTSLLGELLKKLRIHQSGFSKYCIGMAVTDNSQRQNRLKSKIRKITKIDNSWKI